MQPGEMRRKLFSSLNIPTGDGYFFEEAQKNIQSGT
jgi:hypothetical protein